MTYHGPMLRDVKTMIGESGTMISEGTKLIHGLNNIAANERLTQEASVLNETNLIFQD